MNNTEQTEFMLLRSDLSQYCGIKDEIVRLDEETEVAKIELDEVNKYIMNISPVYSGQPTGNKREDKIAEFVIRMDNDRQRLTNKIIKLESDKRLFEFMIAKTEAWVRGLADEELKKILTLKYFECKNVDEIANELFLSPAAINRKIRKFRGGEF